MSSSPDALPGATRRSAPRRGGDACCAATGRRHVAARLDGRPARRRAARSPLTTRRCERRATRPAHRAGLRRRLGRGPARRDAQVRAARPSAAAAAGRRGRAALRSERARPGARRAGQRRAAPWSAGARADRGRRGRHAEAASSWPRPCSAASWRVATDPGLDAVRRALAAGAAATARSSSGCTPPTSTLSDLPRHGRRSAGRASPLVADPSVGPGDAVRRECDATTRRRPARPPRSRGSGRSCRVTVLQASPPRCARSADAPRGRRARAVTGRVTGVVGLSVTVAGLDAAVGELVAHRRPGTREPLLAEVVALDGDAAGLHAARRPRRHPRRRRGRRPPGGPLQRPGRRRRCSAGCSTASAGRSTAARRCADVPCASRSTAPPRTRCAAAGSTARSPSASAPRHAGARRARASAWASSPAPASASRACSR